MNTTTSLETAPNSEPVLTLPGVVATRTGLIVFEGATDAQLHKAFSQIARMDGSLAWWLGDLAIAIQERKRRQLAKESAALRLRANECTTDDDGMEVKRQLLERAERSETKGVVEYTRELCAAHGVSESYVKQCMMWSRFYEPCNRLNGLTPKHHQVAMVAAGGAEGKVETAIAFLNTARDRQLKASELRKEVNLQRAPYAKPDPSPVPVTFEELIAADRWAVKFKPRVEKMGEDQALRLYTLMQGLRELADELRRKINGR